jgi:hypothetical protein
MTLSIDNSDGLGPREYSAAIDMSRPPRVLRRLNKPAELRFSLVANSPDFIVPVAGARVRMGRLNGSDVFTGYLATAPTFEYLGWGENGAVFRYDVSAVGDEFLLDRKSLPDRPPFVERSAGDALRVLADNLVPGAIDSSAVQDLDRLGWYYCDRQKRWSEHAAEISLRARASYTILNGKLTFTPLGERSYTLDESDASFSPQGLKLRTNDRTLNDFVLIGNSEPQAHVKDYFVGDSLSLKFYLSQPPFSRTTRTIVDEEYRGVALNQTIWDATDPASTIGVAGGKLQVSGGTGRDGETTVRFSEHIELGGAWILQHGDVVFNAASNGVLGGLYNGYVSVPACLAGFRIVPAGATSNLQAIVTGSLTGPVMTVNPLHRYVLTTRLFSTEIYRRQQTFHSSIHPGGRGRGGNDIAANVRVVLEVHDIDSANPGSVVAPSTVLYDGVVLSAPGFCIYALVNSADLHCSLAFTRILRPSDIEIRSAFPGQPYRTRLSGSLSEGAECRVSSEPALLFYPGFTPASNELISVHYRSSGRAAARLTDPGSIAQHARGIDDGVRGTVRKVKSPPAWNSADCELAALALLDDSDKPGWTGEYQAWSGFLPGGATDIFPGDLLQVHVPSQAPSFNAIVREVDLELRDLRGERSLYTLRFDDQGAASLAMEFETAQVASPLNLIASTVGAQQEVFLPDVSGAEVIATSSTTITIDAGVAPIAGGFEVRLTDYGWGPDNDRNLLGRFVTQSFTVPRFGHAQTCYVRQFDSSSPTRYSRFSSALHIDYPY